MLILQKHNLAHSKVMTRCRVFLLLVFFFFFWQNPFVLSRCLDLAYKTSGLGLLYLAFFPRSFLQGFCFNPGLWHWSDSKRDDWHYTFRSLFMRDSGIAASARAGWTHGVLRVLYCHPRAGPQTPSRALSVPGTRARSQTPRSGGATGWGAAHPGGRGVCGARNVSQSPPSY